MLLLSSNPRPGHPDTYLTCQMQDAELLPAKQFCNGQMLFIFSTCSCIKSLMSLLFYCRGDTRLVFTWGLPITGFVQRPFCPSFVGHTQDNSSLLLIHLCVDLCTARSEQFLLCLTTLFWTSAAGIHDKSYFTAVGLIYLSSNILIYAWCTTAKVLQLDAGIPLLIVGKKIPKSAICSG